MYLKTKILLPANNLVRIFHKVHIMKYVFTGLIHAISSYVGDKTHNRKIEAILSAVLSISSYYYYI